MNNNYKQLTINAPKTISRYASPMRTAHSVDGDNIHEKYSKENYSHGLNTYRRRSSSVNFRGETFCPKNMYENLTKCPNFT